MFINLIVAADPDYIGEALKGQPGEVFYVNILVFLFAVIEATSLGTTRIKLMIRLPKAMTAVLFLYPYRHKVPIWIVLMQVCNYIIFIIALVVLKIFKHTSLDAINHLLMLFKIMGAFIIIFAIDIIVYDIREKRRI